MDYIISIVPLRDDIPVRSTIQEPLLMCGLLLEFNINKKYSYVSLLEETIQNPLLGEEDKGYVKDISAALSFIKEHPYTYSLGILAEPDGDKFKDRMAGNRFSPDEIIDKRYFEDKTTDIDGKEIKYKELTILVYPKHVVYGPTNISKI